MSSDAHAPDAPPLATPEAPETVDAPVDQEARRWRDEGWTARIIKNEDDEGWAVEMTRDGETEPALVGPWTMGRDKKNPKPIDASAFAVLVKGATEVRMRHEQQRRAQLHRTTMATTPQDDRVRVDLDIVPDEDDPHAILSVFGADGDVTRARVEANFKLTPESATKWIARGGR